MNSCYEEKKCKINWPLFVYFLKKKKEKYKIKNEELLSGLIEKPGIDIKIGNNIYNNLNNEGTMHNKSRTFLKWENESCRYDTFFFLFCFIIVLVLKIGKINFNNNIIKIVIDFEIEIKSLDVFDSSN